MCRDTRRRPIRLASGFVAALWRGRFGIGQVRLFALSRVRIVRDIRIARRRDVAGLSPVAWSSRRVAWKPLLNDSHVGLLSETNRPRAVLFARPPIEIARLTGRVLHVAIVRPARGVVTSGAAPLVAALWTDMVR